ncbi:hypothetical protein [Streptomyces sp. NPDC002825]|uniref:hypothetical protein n=1 Tax=Streptomyces sp. NPDC002825 TaxID=3154666 RepID=UPI00331FDA78
MTDARARAVRAAAPHAGTRPAAPGPAGSAEVPAPSTDRQAPGSSLLAAAAPPADRAAPQSVHPGDLPGVRARLRAVAADLAAGLNCLWLVPDTLVETGLAEELYRGALYTGPVRIDVPAPDPAPTRPREPEPDPEEPWHADDADELPYLDLPDDGFDLDLGWALESRPRVPAPRREPGIGRHDPHGLLARLGKALSVDADEAVATLIAPGRLRRPIVGIRAWTEQDGGTGTSAAPGPGAHAGTRIGAGLGPRREPSSTRPRGAAVEQLFRALAVAVKTAGLPPGERPRLLVVARLGDLPETLPDELRHGLGDTAVHWWWGALGRLDTATAIAPILDHAPATTGRDPLKERIRRAVRAETVVEVCGPDLELARLLAREWDGAQHTLGAALGNCLASLTGPVPADCPKLRRLSALLWPGAELRQAWARGAVVSWEGRLRPHVAVWHPADGRPAPARDGDVRARLAAHVSQAQQRVLIPWIEEARQRLAARALGHLHRPPATVVADYADRPPAHPGGDAESAFLELQVGELLRAHISGALALPQDDARLLRLLVKARNVLAHRSVLYDRTLDELCAALSQADLRA